MITIKTVGIRELKNNLSAYLQDVRRGACILVSDRNTVVAELREPTARYEVSPQEDPVVREWLREGRVTLPSRKKVPLPRSPIRSDAGTAIRLLDEDREDKRP